MTEDDAAGLPFDLAKLYVAMAIDQALEAWTLLVEDLYQIEKRRESGATMYAYATLARERLDELERDDLVSLTGGALDGMRLAFLQLRNARWNERDVVGPIDLIRESATHLRKLRPRIVAEWHLEEVLALQMPQDGPNA